MPEIGGVVALALACAISVGRSQRAAINNCSRLRAKGKHMELVRTSDHVLNTSMRTEQPDTKWHVLFVRSNQEKRVAQHLSFRDIEHFLPLYQHVRQRRDRKVILFTPLFPGYVFVRLSLADRLKAELIPNVVNLIGTQNAQAVIPDQEIEWIKRGLAYGKPEPHPYLAVGDAILIKSGAMAGMEGVFIRDQNRNRVLIRLKSIYRAFSVEVDRDCIEVLPRRLSRYAS